MGKRKRQGRLRPLPQPCCRSAGGATGGVAVGRRHEESATGGPPLALAAFAGGAGRVFLGRRRKEPATGGPRPAGGGERRAAGQVWGGAGSGRGGDRPASVRVREGSRVPGCVE